MIGVKPAVIGPVNYLNQSWRGTFDYVPFNERSGKSARNHAYRGANASVTGSPTWASSKAGVGVYCTGGASFDIPDHGTFGDQIFTHRFVVTIKSWPGDYSCLMDKFGSSRDCSLFFDTSGNVLYTDIATAGAGASVPTGLVAGGTYDLVWTFDGAVSSFYVDGVLKGTDTRTAGGTPQAGPTALGRNPSGGGVNCDAIFHLYHSWRGRVLSAAEVRRLHTEHGGWGLLTRPSIITAVPTSGTTTVITSKGTIALTPRTPVVNAKSFQLAAKLALVVTGQLMVTNAKTFAAASKVSLTVSGKTLVSNGKQLLTAAKVALTVTGRGLVASASTFLTPARVALTLAGQSLVTNAKTFVAAARGAIAYTGLTATLAQGAVFVSTAAGSLVMVGKAIGINAKEFLLTTRDHLVYGGRGVTTPGQGPQRPALWDVLHKSRTSGLTKPI